MTAPKLAYTFDEAAEATGSAHVDICRAVRAGDLPAHRVGVHSLIAASDLERWVSLRPSAG